MSTINRCDRTNCHLWQINYFMYYYIFIIEFFRFKFIEVCYPWSNSGGETDREWRNILEWNLTSIIFHFDISIEVEGKVNHNYWKYRNYASLRPSIQTSLYAWTSDKRVFVRYRWKLESLFQKAIHHDHRQYLMQKWKQIFNRISNLNLIW